MIAEPIRPVPVPTSLSQPFWDACAEGRLIVQRCDHCAERVFIPATFCPRCLGADLTWVASSGSGTVVTFTTVWRPPTPAFEVPYVVAVVRLDEGYEMLSNIVGPDREAVDIGRAVRVCFVEVAPGVKLPCFELVP